MRALALADELGDDWLIGYATIGAGVLKGTLLNRPPWLQSSNVRARTSSVRASRSCLMYAQVNLGLQCYLAQ